MISLSGKSCSAAPLAFRQPPLVLGLVLENENAGINLSEDAGIIAIPSEVVQTAQTLIKFVKSIPNRRRDPWIDQMDGRQGMFLHDAVNKLVIDLRSLPARHVDQVTGQVAQEAAAK